VQAVPFVAVGFEHVPVLGLHVAATWHWSLAVQVTGFDPVHAPDWQASTCVLALPSLHAAPLGAVGFEQRPLVGSQVPATWHWSLATHTIAFDPLHTPLSSHSEARPAGSKARPKGRRAIQRTACLAQNRSALSSPRRWTTRYPKSRPLRLSSARRAG
jgi:hypothetical protein